MAIRVEHDDRRTAQRRKDEKRAFLGGRKWSKYGPGKSCSERAGGSRLEPAEDIRFANIYHV
jgi:hypothetical protein